MGDRDRPGTLQRLVDAVASGDFPIEKLISYYDLADINQAVADLLAGKALKCVLRMPQ